VGYSSLAVSGGGRYVWASGIGGGVEVFDRREGMRKCGEQPGGRWIVASDDGRRMVWDAGGGIVCGKIRESLL
jgi:hypothetical protein